MTALVTRTFVAPLYHHQYLDFEGPRRSAITNDSLVRALRLPPSPPNYGGKGSERGVTANRLLTLARVASDVDTAAPQWCFHIVLVNEAVTGSPSPPSKRAAMPDQRTVFLGYPFALDYIRPAVERAAAGYATIIAADDQLRGMQLLEKIESMMKAADLCLFDLTLHNPNVATEFGIAYARHYKYGLLYCCDEKFNRHPGGESWIFSDVKGSDALYYNNAAELEEKLRGYLPDLLASPTPEDSSPLQMPTAIVAHGVDNVSITNSTIESAGHGLHLKNVRGAHVSSTKITAGGSGIIIGNAPAAHSPPPPPPDEEPST